eukprot:TRINITY_DN2093_c0_g1_i1.p2 TRINITY_DN2093_c0_g1~~TRINITY_DN2093_c0_g1_i1.p2  ORF type:complete len:128 (-),score=24.58 TRINITY_DN2093_c0_g1_i1:379-762(-)
MVFLIQARGLVWSSVLALVTSCLKEVGFSPAIQEGDPSNTLRNRSAFLLFCSLSHRGLLGPAPTLTGAGSGEGDRQGELAELRVGSGRPSILPLSDVSELSGGQVALDHTDPPEPVEKILLSLEAKT